jgi:hypothetical protein
MKRILLRKKYRGQKPWVINFIDTKAKCRQPKKIDLCIKGLCGIKKEEGRGGRGGREDQEKGRRLERRSRRREGRKGVLGEGKRTREGAGDEKEEREKGKGGR